MLAQVSFEFFVLISILIISFIYVFSTNANYYKEVSEKKVYYAAQNIADSIAEEINIAIKSGDGYSRVFYIDNKILDYIDYDIIYYNYTVYIKWKDGYVTSKSFTKNIEGQIMKGKNVIRNVGGRIYVN